MAEYAKHLLGSDSAASDYLDGSNNPLALRVRLWYRKNTDHKNEVMDEIQVENIIDLTPIRWRPAQSASPVRHMEPLWISFAKVTTATNYNNFRACTVTLRFRRTRQHGADTPRGE